jgi:hypothetical protein
MICRVSRPSLPSVTVRLSAQEKQWFSTLARSRGVSESALALSVIRSIADSGCLDSCATQARMPATDRITIRLRPGDGQAIAGRASERGMKASAYLAALVRAHLAANPPLARSELAALKQRVAVLSGLGTLLAQTARNPALSGPGLEDLRQAISRTRAVVTALEQRTHEFTRRALISWESQRG